MKDVAQGGYIFNNGIIIALISSMINVSNICYKVGFIKWNELKKIGHEEN